MSIGFASLPVLIVWDIFLGRKFVTKGTPYASKFRERHYDAISNSVNMAYCSKFIDKK